MARNRNHLSLGQEAREARLRQYVDESSIVSDKTYNLVMGGVVGYGLLVNAIICALVGDTFAYVNPIVFLIGYFISSMAGILIAKKSDNPAISFLGYNLVVVPLGLMVSSLVYAYGGISSTVVMVTFADTLIITMMMIGGAVLFPEFFSRLGGILFSVLIGMLICSLLSFFIRIPNGIMCTVGAVLFSLYIGYDFWRSQQFPKTIDNAVDCALDIYLDIINLFIRLLEIFGRNSRRD